MKYIFLSFFILLSLSACGGGIDRYYCYFNKPNTSRFDKIVLVEGEEPERQLDLALGETKAMSFYKTYDEGKQVITVYEESWGQFNYYILKLDLSGEIPVLSYGGGHHRSVKGFEKSYSMDFTPENLRLISSHSHLIRYLPEKPNQDMVSIAFLKRTLKCDVMSWSEYKIKSGKLLSLQFLGG